MCRGWYRLMPSDIAKKMALLIALRKPAPNVIPLSGEARLKTRDYNSTYIQTVEPSETHLVSSLNEEQLNYLHWNEREREALPASLPLHYISDFRVVIIQYFKDTEITYNGHWPYLFGRITFRARRERLARRHKQSQFNKKLLARENIQEVLSEIYNETMNSRDFVSSPTAYLMTKHTILWLRHPQRDELLNHYELIFEALAESGDLTCERGRYQLTAQSINSLNAMA